MATGARFVARERLYAKDAGRRHLKSNSAPVEVSCVVEATILKSANNINSARST